VLTDYNVEIATPDDENLIVDMFRLMHEENGIFSLSEEKVRNIVRNAASNKGGIIGLIKGEDSLEGMISLVIEQLWYSDEWFLSELFNFVHPDFRRSPRVKSLLSFAKKCSTELKLPLVIGVVSNQRTEAKVKLYERQFPKAGAFFMYNGDYARMSENEFSQ